MNLWKKVAIPSMTMHNSGALVQNSIWKGWIWKLEVGSWKQFLQRIICPPGGRRIIGWIWKLGVGIWKSFLQRTNVELDLTLPNLDFLSECHHWTNVELDLTLPNLDFLSECHHWTNEDHEILSVSPRSSQTSTSLYQSPFYF